MDRNVFNLLLLIVLIALTMNVERSQGLATILLPLPDTSVSGRSLRQRTVMKMNTKKHKQLPRDIPLKYSRLYQVRRIVYYIYIYKQYTFYINQKVL